MPKGKGYSKSGGQGGSQSFWQKRTIRNKQEQPGNPHSAGQKRANDKSHKLTSEKAEKILQDGSIRGHKITPKQKRFFGAVAGGQKPYK